jgi:hypothetical protein
MRDETRRKLDAMLHGENRLHRQVLMWGAIATAAMSLYFVASHKTISSREMSGTVQRAVWRINNETGTSYPDLQIVLDDGRLVVAGTLQPTLPPVGATITVREKNRATGYHSYSWEGAMARPE